jgi:spermidine synthase
VHPRLAAPVVFLASGAVLVLEIVGMRLVAPYVGVTLQTSSSVIGVALTAIALCAWLGGRTADRVDPRRLLAPALLLGGATTMLTVPVVRAVGPLLQGGDPGSVVVLALLAQFVPAVLLAGVTPMVVKLQLRDVGRTGTIVGQLSGVGTLGAILATFATGFVLVAMLPSSAIVIGLGATLFVVGIGLWIHLHGGPSQSATWPPITQALVGAVVVVAALTSPTPCQIETAYHCARVVADPARPDTGRILVFDTLAQSYQDLGDPTHLEFAYVQAIASVADTAWPPGAPISALHVGAGGLTVPRYLAATRPGTQSRVLEIDPGALRLSQSLVGNVPRTQVQLGDARIALRQQQGASRDLVVGDAFGGLAVPWQLTTKEAIQNVRSILRPGGIYVANLIDFPPNRFAAAEMATIRSVLPNMVVMAMPGAFQGHEGGNFVVAASASPLPVAAIQDRLRARGTPFDLAQGPAVQPLTSGARVLTDDHAPVDQLLNPYGQR